MKTFKLKEESKNEIKLPNHIAIIMDGNRRWAKEKNLPSIMGHKEGAQALRKIIRHSGKIGIKYLTVYAFSTENWKRTKEEVDYLMNLLIDSLNQYLSEALENDVTLNFIGNIKELPEKVQKTIKESEEKTQNNKRLNLQIALNYGSRLEIINAVKEICQEYKANKITINDINENIINQHLYTKNIPDPELLIRTGGEFRISNYLLWQSAYTEFYSTKAMWPDFTPEELDKALNEFSRRQRRYGA